MVRSTAWLGFSFLILARCNCNLHLWRLEILRGVTDFEHQRKFDQMLSGNLRVNQQTAAFGTGADLIHMHKKLVTLAGLPDRRLCNGVQLAD